MSELKSEDHLIPSIAVNLKVLATCTIKFVFIDIRWVNMKEVKSNWFIVILNSIVCFTIRLYLCDHKLPVIGQVISNRLTAVTVN